jgi:hypothetical protein
MVLVWVVGFRLWPLYSLTKPPSPTAGNHYILVCLDKLLAYESQSFQLGHHARAWFWDLFKDTLSTTFQYRMMNDMLERRWSKAVVASVKLPEELRKSMKNLALNKAFLIQIRTRKLPNANKCSEGRMMFPHWKYGLFLKSPPLWRKTFSYKWWLIAPVPTHHHSSKMFEISVTASQ